MLERIAVVVHPSGIPVTTYERCGQGYLLRGGSYCSWPTSFYAGTQSQVLCDVWCAYCMWQTRACPVRVSAPWQGYSCRKQSHLQGEVCHLSVLVAPTRLSLTNTFSRILTGSHYERATTCLYIQKKGGSSASLYSSSVYASHFLLPKKLETTQKNAYASTKFPKPQHKYQ